MKRRHSESPPTPKKAQGGHTTLPPLYVHIGIRMYRSFKLYHILYLWHFFDFLVDGIE